MIPLRGRSRSGSRQGLLTILFTDIGGSTALTQRLGDAGAQEIVRAHNAIVRREIARYDGRDVKHTGDGILATFPSATRAVACAVAIQEAARTYSEERPEHAFEVCIGLNAGEPVAEEADVFGTAVQLASRACAEARGGQILATNVVRELVFGKGYLFGDAGARPLKGFDEPVRLYEVAGAEGVVDDDRRRVSLLRRPLVVLAMGVASLATVGGVAAIVIVSLNANGGARAAEYRSFRINYEVEGLVEVTAGDCETTDTVIHGLIPGTLGGEISGTVEADFEVRLPAADDCESLRATVDSHTTTAGGAFTEHQLGVSLDRLGDVVPGAGSATDAIQVGIVVGESGVYEGSVGKNTCRATGLSKTSSEGIVAVSNGDCTMQIAQSADEVPVILQAVGSPLEIAPQLSATGGADTVRIVTLFRNNTEEPLTGVQLRLPSAAGGQIASRADADEPWENGERTFPLDDLAPGEIASFEFTVRLTSASGDTLTLVPEITADDLDFVDRSDPIVLTVVG